MGIPKYVSFQPHPLLFSTDFVAIVLNSIFLCVERKNEIM